MHFQQVQGCVLPLKYLGIGALELMTRARNIAAQLKRSIVKNAKMCSSKSHLLILLHLIG